MKKFLEKCGDYIFPVSMTVFFTALFVYYCIKLSECTAWDKETSKLLAKCISYHWMSIVWILNLKQTTDLKNFNKIKKLLGDKEDDL